MPTLLLRALQDPLPPPSTPLGPTELSFRCFPTPGPRRDARRGSHPPARRSVAELQTAPPGRCRRGPHTPPIERQERDRRALLPRQVPPWPRQDRSTPTPLLRRRGRTDPRAKES